MSAKPVFLGELGLLSLFDLAQLLMLNGATGSLHVVSGARKGSLRFEHGQIANAVDERLREGEDAAYRVFGWRSGTFEFRVEPPTGGRTIHDSTEGLMLEAARRLDEAGANTPGESVTQALQARAGKFEALREAFQRVARDTSAAGREWGGGSAGARFAALAAPGDTLLYRPGRPVRVLQSGRWREAGPAVLDPAAFSQLCTTFFEAAPGEHGPARSVVIEEDGRELLVSRLPAPHEALIVRSAPASRAGVTRLGGDEDAIAEVLDVGAGLVLVGAPGVRAAEQLLYTALARILERRPVAAVLTAERGAWQQGEALGALLLTPRAGLEGALEAFAPDLVAFDVAHADASLDALHHVPLVVCALVAPDAASLLPRWLARHGHTLADAAGMPFAGADVGVLFTPGASAEGDVLPVLAAHAVSSAGAKSGGPRAVRSGPRSEPAADAALRSVIEQLQRELRDAA
jgi:hypothetical protein